MEIRQVGVADGGILVPSIHRVERFIQLGAARLVYAASVNPQIIDGPGPGLLAGIEDLLVSCFLRGWVARVLIDGYHLLKGYFILLPGMRQDSIFLLLGSITHERSQTEGGSVDEFY